MRRFFSKLILIALAFGLLGSAWLWVDYTTYMDSPLKVSQQGLVYELKPGMNLTKLVKNLAEQGVIEKPRYLLWAARWKKKSNHIAVGEYNIPHSQTATQFLDNILKGKVIQYAFTIVEGWSFKQLITELGSNKNIKHLIKSKEHSDIMKMLGYEGVHPEGRFLPDTYHFPKGLSDIDFLKRAYVAMETFLMAEWPRRDAGLMIDTPYQALILASIVEKETGLASEREAIAGVFMRRLEKNNRLQTDPTVIYGMGDSYKGNIRRRDLEKDTPYNTYRRKGLPPTPIAMPGRDAIKAALHPKGGTAFYFVARGDGSHQFSSTLEEHNKAVIKYQLKGKKRSFSSYPKTKENKK